MKYQHGWYDIQKLHCHSFRPIQRWALVASKTESLEGLVSGLSVILESEPRGIRSVRQVCDNATVGPTDDNAALGSRQSGVDRGTGACEQTGGRVWGLGSGGREEPPLTSHCQVPRHLGLPGEEKDLSYISDTRYEPVNPK